MKFALKRGLVFAVVSMTICAAPADNDIFRPGEFFVGCNYWGSKDGIKMWQADRWNPGEIDKDVAALARHGVEVMRVFPTWSDFQPVAVNHRGSNSFGGYLDANTDKPLSTYAGLDDGAMSRFRFFCDTAEKHGIKLMVSLVTGWMSGRLFYPRALEGYDLITDSEAIMWEVRFVREFVNRTKGHPAIVAWDLGNECNNLGRAKRPSDAWLWLNSMASAIRLADGTRPVVSGMHGISSDARDNWNLQNQGELLDVLTPHPYPSPFRVDANRGPFNGFRNALHQVGQCLFYEGVGRKRAFPQEVGNFGPTICPDAMAAAGFRQEMFASWQHGMAGFLWWCAFRQMNLDYAPFELNAMERELGLLNPDAGRTPLPQAEALREFKAFKDSLPFRALPARATEALCILSEHEDFWQTSYGAFMLAKQAGFDIEFAGSETTREWPRKALYILPSGKDWETYTNTAWKRVLECVERDGATLLVSRGGRAGYSDWERVSGQQTVMYMEARDIAFDFAGRTLRGSDAFTTIVTPTGCEVLARDQTGNPVVTRRRLGKGQVIAVNFALEHLAMTKLQNVFEGDFSNELWRIYAAAAKAAGVKRAVTREDTRLVLTEHPRPDGSRLVCALNTRPEPISVPVVVEGAVGKVWNGRYVDGKLEIAANDGCMFEVK